MNAQRTIGKVFGGFCLALLLINPIGRWTVHEPLFLATDWTILIIGALLAVSAFWESKTSKALQIFAFVLTGCTALYNESAFIGMQVLNMGFFLAIYYGWYDQWGLPKVFVTGALIFGAVMAFDKVTTNNNLVATMFWMTLFILQAWFLWVLFRDKMRTALLIAKTYKDELEKKERGNAP